MFNPNGGKSYAEGDLIALDPEKELRHKSIALLVFDGVPVLRQILIEGDGTRLMEALNPAWPNRISPLPYGTRVLGVVIGKWVPE